ncbi:radical SAM protein [Niallia circulans]|uniref:radical SAM protein n=1 Tax=Niallia circulans TaxID=1397 RepID=UPI0026EFACF5|nr:radical SAM protein [Niallia circulans]
MCPNRSVNFLLTNKCNLRCKYCFLSIPSIGNKENDILEEDIIIKKMEKLRKSNVREILFSGGEPLLYPNIKSILIQAQNMEFTTSLYTNGYLSLQNVLPYLDNVYLSLDGNKDTHNRIRGNYKSFQRLWNNIMEIFKFNQCNKKNIKCNINCVVTSDNINLIESDFSSLIEDDIFCHTVNNINLCKVSSEGEVFKNKYLLIDNDSQKEQIREIANRLTKKSKYKVIFLTNLYSLKEFKRSFPSPEFLTIPIWFDFSENKIYLVRNEKLYSIDKFAYFDEALSEHLIKSYRKIDERLPKDSLFDPFEVLNS